MILNSKINKKPLFLIEKFYKKRKLSERHDLTDYNHFLQVSFLKLKKGKKVNPHSHLNNFKNTNISNECWLVISGRLKVKFYDIDDTFVHEDILNKGDLSILFQGGHELSVLTDNTKIFEIKNGPYLGVDKEREYIKKI